VSRLGHSAKMPLPSAIRVTLGKVFLKTLSQFFAECLSVNTRQRGLCRVPDRGHSAKRILKFLKNLYRVPDHGHSAKKGNKRLSRSSFSFFLSTHPLCARRRPPARLRLPVRRPRTPRAAAASPCTPRPPARRAPLRPPAHAARRRLATRRATAAPPSVAAPVGASQHPSSPAQSPSEFI
jgi:hypothetical protein